MLFLPLFFIGTSIAPLTGSKAWAGGLEVIVEGEPNFKIVRDVVHGAGLEGALLKREGTAVILTAPDGLELARANKGKEGEIVLSKSGVFSFTLIGDSEGYRIITPDGAMKNRIKLKADKFNLYDANGQRLAHGKPRPNGFGVKDEKGQQILKIKGIYSLKEASFFTLPIDSSMRIVAWGCEYL